MYNNEQEVARKSEQMLESALRRKTTSFRDHINRREGDPSLKDATAKASLKRYGSVRRGNRQFFMRSLSIKMGKHGFIQHYGVDKVRSGGTRTRQKPKETTYSFKSHMMKMRAQPFINEAVESSGVVDFVMTEVTRLRSEEIMVNVRQIMENR